MHPEQPHPPPTDADPLDGTAYRTLRRLGAGSTAEVYEAVHTALGKTVAVKVLRREHAGDAMSLERMRFEAQTLARLRHPNVTAVTDLGQTADGRPFFVMERHEGRSLLAELRQRGRLPVSEAVELVRGALAGLSAAHALGIVHRDVKLENLLLCEGDDGRRLLKVLDFGIAKLLPGADPVRAPAPLAWCTEEGVTLGTPRFLSPEQVMCRPVDGRTDVYGAAIVLYELVAGRDPFHHVEGYVGLLRAHVSEDPVPPSTLASQRIEPALDDVILRALAKRPEDRYATAEEFSAALARAVLVEPAPTPAPRTASLSLTLLIVIGAAAISAAVTLLLHGVP